MYKRYLSMILLTAIGPVAMAQSHTLSRLLQEKNWSSIDSIATKSETHYTYSGNRGGDPDTTIQFDTKLQLNRSISGTLTDTFHQTIQSWDVHGGLIEVLDIYDPTYATRTRSTCDIKGNCLVSYFEEKYTDTFEIYGRRNYSYTAAGLVDTSTTYTLEGGDYYATNATTYQYDAAGHLTDQLSWVGYPTHSTLTLAGRQGYEYTASGNTFRTTWYGWNAAKIAWDTFRKVEAYYSAAGDYDSVLYCDYLGGDSWKQVQVNIDQYDAKHRLIRQSKGAISTAPFNVYLYSYEGDSIRHTLFLNQFVSKLDSASIQTDVYNKYGQLTYKARWARSSLAATWIASATSYIYELYTLSVTELSKGGTMIEAWPVPASDRLQIKISLTNASPCTMLLYDLQGKVWKIKDLPPAMQYTENIDVATLPAGTYCVLVKAGESVQAVRKITIVH